MKRILFIALWAIANTGNAQDKVLPAEAKPFVVKGYEMMDYITGDLNGDKRPDAILILKVPGEDSVIGNIPARPLILLLRQANGSLKAIKRNDQMILCHQCGGVFGDPYEDTRISKNSFVINFYGGSNWRWGIEYTFRYDAASNNWLLMKEKQENYQSGDPEKTMKVTHIGPAELAGINFDNFNATPSYDDSKWKVVSAKTYFYDSPGIGNKPRKGYLLKGNTVTGIRELKNFVEVSFENTKEKITEGFVLKKDLLKIR